MDVRYDDGAARVELSERNIRDLVEQFDTFGLAELHRMTDNGYLQVLVVPDTQHYGEREPGPGGLAFMATHRSAEEK